jgi:hypothetical protein
MSLNILMMPSPSMSEDRIAWVKPVIGLIAINDGLPPGG